MSSADNCTAPEDLPPEESPRLKSWRPINFTAWASLAARIATADVGTGAPLQAALASLQLCWQRLHDDYVGWFIPEGPPGTHAHIHYRKPDDEGTRRNLLAAMGVDYESALGYLYTALDQTARGFGLLTNLPVKTWFDLVKVAEAHGGWPSNGLRQVVKEIQRGALYARSKAVVHPGPHFVVTRWDNTGNVTHIRLPVDPPSRDAIVELDAMWHRLQSVRDDVHIGTDPAPWQVVQFLDLFSAAHVDEADRSALLRLREAVGFALPGAYVIGPAIDRLVDQLVAATLPTS